MCACVRVRVRVRACVRAQGCVPALPDFAPGICVPRSAAALLPAPGPARTLGTSLCARRPACACTLMCLEVLLRPAHEGRALFVLAGCEGGGGCVTRVISTQRCRNTRGGASILPHNTIAVRAGSCCWSLCVSLQCKARCKQCVAGVRGKPAFVL